MGPPTKVQLIQRKDSEQWYINFPAALAQSMQFERGEMVEWIIEDRSQLVLRRRNPPPSAKKNHGGRPRRALARTVRPGAARLRAAAHPGTGAPVGCFQF